MSFVQIGSWNVEHLSNRSPNPQSAYALADHIEMAGIDILALQEIYVTHFTDEGERRNRDLDTVCTLLQEHLGTEWRYRILQNRTPGDKSQLCAALWNTARAALSGIEPVGVAFEMDGDRLWDRAPHAMKFSVPVRRWRQDDAGDWSQQDETSSLVVVPLHMKSNVGGAVVNRHKRTKEAQTLVDALPAALQALGDESLVLIGDTNILDRNEPAIEILSTFGLRDLNDADTATYPGYGGSPFDRAFVRANREEFKYSRQYILQSSSEMQHDKFLSDHYMIKVSVKIYLDDADPR